MLMPANAVFARSVVEQAVYTSRLHRYGVYTAGVSNYHAFMNDDPCQSDPLVVSPFWLTFTIGLSCIAIALVGLYFLTWEVVVAVTGAAVVLLGIAITRLAIWQRPEPGELARRVGRMIGTMSVLLIGVFLGAMSAVIRDILPTAEALAHESIVMFGALTVAMLLVFLVSFVVSRWVISPGRIQVAHDSLSRVARHLVNQNATNEERDEMIQVADKALAMWLSMQSIRRSIGALILLAGSIVALASLALTFAHFREIKIQTTKISEQTNLLAQQLPLLRQQYDAVQDQIQSAENNFDRQRRTELLRYLFECDSDGAFSAIPAVRREALMEFIEIERQTSPQVKLYDLDLSKLTFRRAFKDTEFINCNFADATFTGGLNDIVCIECNFKNANFEQKNVSGSRFQSCVFSGSSWRALNIMRTEFMHCGPVELECMEEFDRMKYKVEEGFTDIAKYEDRPNSFVRAQFFQVDFHDVEISTALMLDIDFEYLVHEDQEESDEPAFDLSVEFTAFSLGASDRDNSDDSFWRLESRASKFIERFAPDRR